MVSTTDRRRDGPVVALTGGRLEVFEPALTFHGFRYAEITGHAPGPEDVTARVDKFTIYFPEGDAQKGYDALYGPVWGGRFSVAVAGADWVDIMNPGVHKGAALLLLGERLGVPPEGMMAFGDTFNDAEMLKAAKYGFLVENGSPALREEVPFLAPPNTSSGVMQVLRRVLARNGRVCESDFRRAK